tara:strand:- start:1985 stop:2191 length:207 start_codon:yes stop_codon:yes gene_type:complete
MAEDAGLEPARPFERLLSREVQYHYANLPERNTSRHIPLVGYFRRDIQSYINLEVKVVERGGFEPPKN